MPPDRERPPVVLPAPRRARPGAERTDDLQRTLADLVALLQGVTGAMHELGRVGGRLRGAADEFGHALGEAWEIARARGGGAFRAIDGTLFQRPYVTVAAALALGAVAGLALSRARARDGRRVVEDDGWDHFV